MKIRWMYVGFAYLSLLALGLYDNLRGPFFPQILEDLQLNDAKGSLFFVAASFSAFIGSLLAGRLIHYFGSLWALRTGLLAMSIGFYFISGAQNLPEMAIYAAIFGVGFGVIGVSEHTTIQEGASPSSWRRLFSGLHCMYAASALIAPILARQVFIWHHTWRDTFYIVTLVPLAVILFSFIIKKNTAAHVEADEVKTANIDLKNRIFFGLLTSFYLVGELSLSTRIVLLVHREQQMPLEQASKYLAIFFLLLLVGRLFFTLFNFKHLKNETIIKWSLLASSLFYFLGLFVNPYFMSVCGLTMAPFFAIEMNYVAEIFREKSPQVISYCLAVSSLAVVAMHYTLGFMTDIWGIKIALIIAPIGLFLAFIQMQFFNPNKLS